MSRKTKSANHASRENPFSVGAIPLESARLSPLLSIPQYDAALRSKENIKNYVTYLEIPWSIVYLRLRRNSQSCLVFCGTIQNGCNQSCDW